jgi:SAM-dependent methyltransferase
MDAFGAYARYYDLLYRDKDYPAEAQYVQELIQRYAPGASSILDLGCGTGTHAEQFALRGYEVRGVDVSEGMLQSARARQSRLTPEVRARLDFSTGDVRSFRAGRRFDVVTALFHVVSYQVTDEDLAMTFATAAAHLAPGGIFLFDCWYGPAVLSDPPVVRAKRLEDAATSVVRTANPTMRPEENVTDVDYQVLVTDLASGQTEEIRERHRLRYLFGPELVQCLQAAGLEPVHFSEWFSDAVPSAGTWNVVMVGRSAISGGG